jgi:putative methionine-R-sulfoxide reductase with GAF domain
MSDSIVRDLAAVLDTLDMREVRARRAAEIVRAARNYRWVGVYDVDDDRVELVGHTGVRAPVFVEFSTAKGLTGEAVRTRGTVICNDVAGDPRYLTAFESTGSEMIVPILGAESGIAIGTLDVESDRVGAFTDDDRDFVERCATALMPLFE